MGDHGEAFGEHGLYGHERIAFDEALKIPFCLRAPFLVAPGIRVTEAVSSVDLTPTLLTMLGFDISGAGFDGLNVLGSVPDERKVYFAGWMRQGTTGFIRENRKFIYSPTNKMVTVYDLNTDPFELVRGELSEEQVQEISDDVIAWQKSTIFRINQQRSGKKVLFESWLCRWTDRVSSAKYLEKNGK